MNAMGLPIFEFDNQDSLAIESLADSYLSLVNSGDFESAANMLYMVQNDSVLPLDSIHRAGYLNTMQTLPNFGFTKMQLELNSNRDNRLRIAMKIAEDGNPETGTGVINFFLNPIEHDGVWRLTLLDKYAEGVGLYHYE